MLSQQYRSFTKSLGILIEIILAALHHLFPEEPIADKIYLAAEKQEKNEREAPKMELL